MADVNGAKKRNDAFVKIRESERLDRIEKIIRSPSEMRKHALCPTI
jgi:hypothetical protein